MKEIIWDVSSQNDNISNYDVKKNIRNVLMFAQKKDIDIYGSVDIYYNGNCCRVNTPGCDKILESIISHPDNIYYVPNTGNGIDLNLYQGAQQMYFEKQSSNVWDKKTGQPDNIQTILRMIDATNIYIIGARIFEDVMGFINKQYNVILIDDAIQFEYENSKIEMYKLLNGYDKCNIISLNEFKMSSV